MSKREYLDTSYLDVEGDKITAHSNSHSHEITPPGVTSTYTISIGDLKEEDLLKLTSTAGENLTFTGDDWENVTTTMNMSQVDFEAFGRYIAGAEDLGLNPFWKTEEFKDTEFQIVDNQLEMKPSASGVGAEASAFFVDVLKPMVDMYLSRNPTEDTWPNGDGVTDDNYDRAMSYLR